MRALYLKLLCHSPAQENNYHSRELLFHSLYFLKQHISSRIRVLNWLLPIFTIWKALFGFFLKITVELYVLDLFLNFYSRKRTPTCLCCQAPHSHPPTHPELICSNATFGQMWGLLPIFHTLSYLEHSFWQFIYCRGIFPKCPEINYS